MKSGIYLNSVVLSEVYGGISRGEMSHNPVFVKIFSEEASELFSTESPLVIHQNTTTNMQKIEQKFEDFLKSQGLDNVWLDFIELNGMKRAFAAGAAMVYEVFASSNSEDVKERMSAIAQELSDTNLHD